MSIFIQQYGAFLFGLFAGGVLTYGALQELGKFNFLVVTIGRPGKDFIEFESAVKTDTTE